MTNTSDIDRFAAKLNTTPNPTVEALWKKEWADKVAIEMRGRVPVDTRRLRDSITPSNDGVEVGAEYGTFVESGTSNTAPQPFAGPSVDKLARTAAEDAGRRVIRELT